MPQSLPSLQHAFRALGNPEQATLAQRFFKTGPGEYGEGDRFLGIRVPDVRAFLPRTDVLGEAELIQLLHSMWHEERLLSLLAMVRRFSKARRDEATRERLVELYLANTAWINNWDLVDTSAPHILGEWLRTHDRAVLDTLAASSSLWEQRIAVLATQAFIRAGEFADTLRLCEQMLTHRHDLMHKACGWMLREVGKRDEATMCAFLEAHAKKMPRTMLRYAIEKLTPEQRRHFMA